MPKNKRVVFDPTKSSPQEERPKPLSEQDRRVTKAEISQLEAQVNAPPALSNDGKPYYTPQPSDVGVLKKQLDQKKMLLARDEDGWARGTEKDRLMVRQKEIEDILKAHKPTQREMGQMPTGQNSSAFSRAVDHNVRYLEKYQTLEHELQDIRVRLEPHDPNAHSLEYLRSDISDGAVTV